MHGFYPNNNSLSATGYIPMVCLDYQVNAYFLKAFMGCAKYAEAGKQTTVQCNKYS